MTDRFDIRKRVENMKRRYVGIDPSTRTGLVVLTRDGEIVNAQEIRDETKYPRDIDNAMRLRGIVSITFQEIETENDWVAIEGFSYNSRQGRFVAEKFGLGYLFRDELNTYNMPWIAVPPALVKKFAGTSGKANKEQVAVAVYKRWGFEHGSNNVVDAFVLAQISRAMFEPPGAVELTAFQWEVIKKLKKVSA